MSMQLKSTNQRPMYKRIDVNGHIALLVAVKASIPLLERVDRQARLKAGYVERDDPEGKERTDPEILSQNFLGVLAETICAEILDNYFKKHSIPITVERYDDVRTDDFKKHDLYDIKLTCNEQQKIVEVRSSVCVFMPMETMVEKWQILGPYVSEAKGTTETDKPFYMRILYHLVDYDKNIKERFYTRSDGIDCVKSGGFQIYFVGGATSELLRDKGRDEDSEELKQGKSKFRVLDITDGLDAEKFLEVISRTFSSPIPSAQPGRN